MSHEVLLNAYLNNQKSVVQCVLYFRLPQVECFPSLQRLSQRLLHLIPLER